MIIGHLQEVVLLHEVVEMPENYSFKTSSCYKNFSKILIECVGVGLSPGVLEPLKVLDIDVDEDPVEPPEDLAADLPKVSEIEIR